MLKFGTSGIRGLVTEFTKNEVHLLCAAFLQHAKNIGQLTGVAIASDLRQSSPEIKAGCLELAQSWGLETFDCGNLPTPALALYTQTHQCLGIMVTGSHIPADRNGIKFYLKTGETLKHDDQAIYGIYENLKLDPKFALGVQKGSSHDASVEAKNLYLRRYQDFFPASILAGLKLLFYQHSSVARDIYPEILRSLGAEVVCIGRSETFIPVDTEAIDAVDQFKEWISQHHADALISTDGDADRPLFVDSAGAVIPGDKLGALASIYLGCEAIALPISCNSGILQVPNFKKIVTTKIGSPFVVEALNNLSREFGSEFGSELGAVAGFEANGGYILQSAVEIDGHKIEKLPTRDAVLPILCVLALSRAKSLCLSEVINLLPHKYTASGLLRDFALERSQALLAKVFENPAGFFKQILPNWSLQLLNVNNLDGLRCEFANSLVVHLRPSGNAPEFRCYTEAGQQDVADKLCLEVLKAL